MSEYIANQELEKSIEKPSLHNERKALDLKDKEKADPNNPSTWEIESKDNEL